MNPTEDESPDELTREYRRASIEQAGRPAATTRAAILAEARAAALRRTPAANDSRVWWRAAASVAVVGVAVLLWRQVDRDGGPVTQVEQVARVEAPSVSKAAPVEADAALDRSAEAQPRVAPARVVPARAAQGVTAGAANVDERREREAVAQAIDAPPPPRPQAAEPALAATALSDASLQAETRRDSLSKSEALGSSVKSETAAQLLKRQFPAEYVSSAPPRGLWILQDAAGGVLRSGRLNDDEGFGAVTLKLEREFPGQNIGPWNVTSVKNAHGVALELGIAPFQPSQR